MFAPQAAKSPAKARPDAANDVTRRRPPPNVDRHGPVEQALLLQRTVGNHATLRILAQRTNRNPPGANPPLPPGTVHRKLTVGSVNDPLEHEADHIAEQVMRTPAPGFSVTSANSTISRKCAACDQDEDMVRTKPMGSSQPTEGQAPAIVREVLDSPRPATAVRMPAPSSSCDLGMISAVCGSHSDAIAAQSASAINALAYTVGEHTVFAAGQYAPADRCRTKAARPRVGPHHAAGGRSTDHPPHSECCGVGIPQ